MATNQTGKWVQRAASTGGGKTYRGQTPVNYYAALVIICVVGFALIVVSRYQLSHTSASSSGPPTTQQVWHAALGIDICGTIEPNLPASTNKSQTGLIADGNGVLTIAPKNSSESGANATLGKFVQGYKGLQLTNSTIQYPGKPVYSNGQFCPKGTPDAGKAGVVIVYQWPNFTSKSGSQTPGDPQSLLFTNGQLITMAFVPAGTTIPKPPSQAITNLITAANSGPTVPSTTAPATATTAPVTATTAPVTSTTAPVTSTTAPVTSTTAPATTTTAAGSK